jgi:hypothetical protein
MRLFSAEWGASTHALAWPAAAGRHTCNLCGSFRAGGNFGVADGDVLFVCPEMITHYVERHMYAPPAEFITAIAKAADPRSEAYAASVHRFRLPPPSAR